MNHLNFYFLGHGYVWEELLMKLPIDAQYLFTSSNFSNIDAFARKAFYDFVQ
jgi:hypothetical protein